MIIFWKFAKKIKKINILYYHQLRGLMYVKTKQFIINICSIKKDYCFFFLDLLYALHQKSYSSCHQHFHSCSRGKFPICHGKIEQVMCLLKYYKVGSRFNIPHIFTWFKAESYYRPYFCTFRELNKAGKLISAHY